jgi:hypothetical protein
VMMNSQTEMEIRIGKQKKRCNEHGTSRNATATIVSVPMLLIPVQSLMCLLEFMQHTLVLREVNVLGKRCARCNRAGRTPYCMGLMGTRERSRGKSKEIKSYIMIFIYEQIMQYNKVPSKC